MSVFDRLMLMNPSPELGSTALFLARGIPYTVDDAIASAIFRGALDAAIEETLRLAAAEERAAEEGFEADDGQLQASSESFRYEHDLISAGETEEWLEARGLTTEDFGGWLNRRLCEQATASADTATQDLIIPDNFPDLLRVHLWMSDAMDELTTDLSRRIAAGLKTSEQGETPSTEPVMQKFLEQQRLDEPRLSGWLAALGRDRSWLSEAVRLEAAFDRVASLAVTADARNRLLASMRLSLGRIEIETLELDSEAAAREAFLCVRDDGMSLAELALESGYRAQRVEMWTDMVDETLGPRLLGAGEGDVIGPIATVGRFKVCHVLRKLAPVVTDPAVCHRLDEVIVDQFFADLCARHIQAPDTARTEK